MHQIKLIKVKKQIDDWKEANKAYDKAEPLKEHVDFIYTDKEHVRVEDENGNMVATLLKRIMPEEMTKEYYSAIMGGGAIGKTSNRSTSSGQEAVKKPKMDGTQSNTSVSPEPVNSSIIGYFDRYPRNNYCRKSAWTLDNPERWQTACEYTEQVNKLFAESCPKEYLQHTNFSKKTSPDFIIGKTAFTTITLNKNFRTFYHRDAGNLAEGFAAMSFIKTGKFIGGELVFPNYRFAVKLSNFDLIIFKNTEHHGNLAINAAAKNADYERITSVFFYRQNMICCGTTDEELQRSKRNKGDQIIGPCSEDLNGGRWGND